ncbi:MAG: thioredoxin domain-containing protein [Desulfobulbaceae bacterium]|nr:thioredoxin domain-containing protein [Desulfobulbaceae bacterium]HIJ79299.1 thioredoxin domain-containing protein [Deltaproteobacteria bacterium]
MGNHSTITDFLEGQVGLGKTSNKLIAEKSPYLLQHAFNPVAWLPWGEAAFVRAREEDKPVFLSIGYSTCHWCHVMARESFENDLVASLLNENFVCVKVDREERPDIDQLYMAAVQAMTGHGGWPLTLFLTPERKPFFGGTYFPLKQREGMIGFIDLLQAIDEGWRDRRHNLLESAEGVISHLKKSGEGLGDGAVDDQVFDKAYHRLTEEFDGVNGGFGKAPKFPRPALFNFLFRYRQVSGNEQALNMALFTLRKMAAGGMYDHVGGGFHRYAVDGQWRVPHFEKMLYDQAQLAISYLEAFQICQDPFYANVAQDILDYVLRELTGAEGGFYAAEDADSNESAVSEKHGEGLYYLWTDAEIDAVLGRELGEIFKYHYGVLPGGNVVDDHFKEFTGKNILYVAQPLAATAHRFQRPEDELAALLERARAQLFAVRRNRPRPHLDDKIITSWNGHMISALARAFQVLGEERYLQAAQKTAKFIQDNLYDCSQDLLFRRYRDHEAGVAAVLDDYAFLVNGLLDLYEASFDIDWLKLAERLTKTQLRIFEDKDGGGFFDTAADSVPLRMKADYDGAEPTGNSVAAANLLRLSRMIGNEQWLTYARQTIDSFSRSLNDYPTLLPQMLGTLILLRANPRQIVVAGTKGKADLEIILAMIRKRFLPDKTLLLADGAEGQAYLARGLAFMDGIDPRPKRARVYFCENFTCRLPVVELAELITRLDAMSHNRNCG